ncbi:MAG: alpha/beta hydrolase [Hyphomonas sp.]|jgi:pimeloyl-ACP methyl ester carboxylesterase|nr:alpha/beta hydrolase [Hyphomonas sp.]
MTENLSPAARALLDELVPRPISAAPGQNMLPPNARRDVGEIPLWRAHEGAATLFVHGWNDTHRIWRQYAQDFLSNTRAVLLMDLPGHGASKSKEYGADAAGKAVFDVCAAEAPIDTIIAHSFGCIATASALKAGATADYVVLIAPPVLGWAEAKRREGADPAALAAALDHLKAAHASEPGPFDFAAALAGFTGKLLFIGSDADIGCPLDEIAAVATNIPGAEVYGVEDLDHRELCLDREVLEKILTFLGYA